VSGFFVLILALFITYEVIARKMDIIKAPGVDQMSGYVMAFAMTWAFSYALRSGAHVRIDVFLPYMSPPVRWVADVAAIGSIAYFVTITSWKVWIMVFTSYDIGAHSLTYPRTPLWIPQMVLGIGFSLCGLTAYQMIFSMVTETLLPRLHKLMGGDPSAVPVAGRVVQEMAAESV
jgi:TRAP-type mannitol/chloroaromatic compound transport system permease small subunit